jgi:ribosome biogenesis protein BRX1
MAAVYKALSNSKSAPSASSTSANGSNGLPKALRNRVLLLTSRGVTFRHRHLLNDLASMLPHARKESKLDTKTKLHQLNELAELYNCNNVLFFEARKGKDLYAWVSRPPNGPTIKFHVQNLHTMDELHFTGNCLKGSRPLLSFDANFDSAPHTKLIKECLTHMFNVPKGARKSKPFVDHVVSFTLKEGRIWFRCYQISENLTPAKKDAEDEEMNGDAKGAPKISLIEIGPRFVLTPIVILESSFGGPVIYENKEFVSPNAVRAELRSKKATKYSQRARKDVEGRAKRDDLGLVSGGRKIPRSELDDTVLFA